MPNKKTDIYKYATAVLAIIVVILLIYRSGMVTAPQSTTTIITYTTTRSPTTIAYTTTAPYVLIQHTVTLIKAGTVFKLGAQSVNLTSFVAEAIQLPVNSTNIRLTGSYTSSANVLAAIFNPEAYGSWNWALGNTTKVFENASNNYFGNSTGNYIDVTLPPTIAPRFYNYTCYPKGPFPNVTDCIGNIANYTVHWLIFDDNNQNTNDTLTITNSVVLTYTH